MAILWHFKNAYQFLEVWEEHGQALEGLYATSDTSVSYLHPPQFQQQNPYFCKKNKTKTQT